VTGGAGFIGSNLIEALLLSGAETCSVDDYSSGIEQNHIEGCEYHNGDVSEAGDLESIGRIDFIFHLAAKARISRSFEDSAGYFKANAMGTMGVCRFALERSIPLVYAGTGSNHGGRYRNPYTFSKAVGEDVVRMNMGLGLKASIARFFNVYGPRELIGEDNSTLVGAWRGRIARGEVPVIYGDGTKVRDFTHVRDITEALMSIMQRRAFGFEFDLGRGSPLSVLEVSRMFGRGFEFRPDRRGEMQESVCDNSLARKVLGWNPSRNLKDYVDSEKIRTSP
jgi:nucleoside-diphosphate-sugar epimerase